MHPIVECMEKDSRLVVGLMSGTSADGVDAALCRITGHGTASKIEQLGFVFQPFSGEIRREILRLASGNSACAAELPRLLRSGTTRFILGHLSRNNNTPLLAFSCAEAAMIDAQAQNGKDYLLSVASPKSNGVTVI